MSSYNGENYISHQIDSILSQSDVEVEIFIRDDGSKDKTVAIIKNYIKEHNNVHFIQGENVGVIESFRLIAEYVYLNFSPCEFYAFADQDDEWLPNKLSAAINKLYGKITDWNKPVLYYSNLKVADNNLKYLYDRFPENYVLNTKKQIMSEICTLGCTCVFNYALLQEYIKTNLKHRIPHDAWVTVLAAFLGEIIYDNEAFILYRQHGNNQSGSVKKGLSMYWDKLKHFKHIFDMDGDYEAIAKEMLDNYNEALDDNDLAVLKTIAEYRNNIKFRFKLMFTKYINSGHIWKEIARRIRIICNRL